ncbi:MAG: S9 family peptidase [Saprospiraceae bacterium]|nr:S9 family peptidase [Saprospiraceae bacterium]
MKKICLVICLLHSGLFMLAQEKKPISHESMWLLKRVGAPAISPNGSQLVYSISEPSYDEKEQVSDLWIMPVSGNKQARRLTTGKAGEGNYSWSPDGKYLAFTAKREGDEAGQIYLLNIMEGGEAQRLTQVSTGASGIRWSPDGKRILFNSSVFPGCFADSCNKKKIEDKKKQKYLARVYTSFPIRNWDKWKDEKQTHLFVQHIDSTQARDLFLDVRIVNETGFILGSANWTKDGKDILFAASTEGNTQAYREPVFHLYSLSVNGGTETKLTDGSFEYSDPTLSDDGKYLLCLENAHNNGKLYNLPQLVRFDWPTMEHKKYICKDLDRPIQQFTSHGQEIYLTAEDHGRDKLFVFSIQGGNAKSFDQLTVGSYSNLSLSNTYPPAIVSNWESVNNPAEIVRIDKNGPHKLLSEANKSGLDSLKLSTYETFYFTSSRGKKIRNLLVKPANFEEGKKYPLFVVIHGGPAGAWKENWSYRWNYHLLASPGYVLLFTDYTGSTGYGEKFTQDIILDPFKGPADEINEAAAYAIKKYAFIDGNLQAAGGASYGGHLANWLQATTSHYKCLISHAGLVNSISQWGSSDHIFGRELMNGGTPWSNSKIWKEQNPMYYADQFKTPMLVTIGELDYRVPVNNSIENWNILQRQKIPSKLIVFPEENHWILKAENSRFFYKELHAWLKTYLNP